MRRGYLYNPQKQVPLLSSSTNMTVTNLLSLASSATVGWQSDRVSNLSNKATDYQISVKLSSTGTTSSDKAMYIYACPFYTPDNGTTWSGSSLGTATLPTGVEGTVTIATPNNLRLLGILNFTTSNSTVIDTFFLSNVCGNNLPDGFSIIIINFCGATLASSGLIVTYKQINPIYI